MSPYCRDILDRKSAAYTAIWYIYIYSGLRHTFAVPTMLDPTQPSPSSKVKTLQKFSEVFVLNTEAALSECCPRLV